MVELESFPVEGTEGVIPEVSEILLEVPVKFAEILNLFSSRFFSFFDFALLGFPDRTFAESFNN
jgi:hypothetical protein